MSLFQDLECLFGIHGRGRYVSQLVELHLHDEPKALVVFHN